MPRINGVRVHNIHFDAGGQPRIYDDTVFEPLGENTLLLLGNGGGKTLLLHLIAQVVEPNIPLQGRRIKRLVEKEKFTGHVLVEWLLDGAAPRYLLTGFCFADPIGGGHQDMDYFTYLYSYDEGNRYDLRSLPLTDEANRTLNISQFRKSLKDSPLKVYPSYRRKDYREQLKSYQIDPREWRYILKINDSEGGIENFFEGCSKTRTLLDKLLIPMIDEVLERREEQDPLREAFRGTAREVMELPQLKVQSEALEVLLRELPTLARGLARVDGACRDYGELLVERAVLLKTVTQGLARLEEEREKLLGQQSAEEREQEHCALILETLGVEEKRRVRVAADKKVAAQEIVVGEAKKCWQASRERYDLYRAFQWWGLLLREEKSRAELVEQLNLYEQGEAGFKEELNRLRAKTAPLLQGALAAAVSREEELQRRQARQIKEEKKIADAVAEAGAGLEKTKQELSHLQTLQEQFQVERRRFLEKVTKLKLPFDGENPRRELAKIKEMLVKIREKREEGEEREACLTASRLELGEQRVELTQKQGQLSKERQQLAEEQQKWWEQALYLKGELQALGFPHHPAENSGAALVWLNQKEEQLAVEQGRWQQDRHRWQEREQLWGEGRTPRPHGEIDLVVEELARLQITAQPAVELLKEYPAKERQQMLAERPWLPYALVIEPSRLSELKERPRQLRAELSFPVPLIARTAFHAGASSGELYFLSHRGLEPFHSEERLAQYRLRISNELERIADELRLCQEEGQKARDLRGRLESFRRGFPYAQEADWEEALRRVEEKYSRQLVALEENGLRRGEVERKKEKNNHDLRQWQERQRQLERARDWGEDYLYYWVENEKQNKEAGRLKEKEEKQKKQWQELATALEEERTGLDRTREELKNAQYEAGQYRQAWDRYFQEREKGIFEGEMAASQKSFLDQQQKRQLDRLLVELAAKVEALEERLGDYRRLGEEVEKAGERIRNFKENIADLGLEPARVEESYRPVERSEINEVKESAHRDRLALEKADGELQKCKEEAGAAASVYQDRLTRIQERFPGKELPSLKQVDLALEREGRQKRSEELRLSLLQLKKGLELKGEQLTDYRRATGILEQMKIAYTETVEPLTEEQEGKEVLGRALEVVERSRRKEKGIWEQLEIAKKQAGEQWHLCQEKLNRLHGDELKQFFKVMGEQMAAPSWEQRVAELQDHLQQVEEAIRCFREQVQQRLEGLTAKVEEMVQRTWRHVDGVLEQVRELQRRSQVPLRGEKHPLFKISFMRPDKAEGAARLRRYLEDVIAEGVSQRKKGEDDTLIDDFLGEAIETARLLDQVVSLDGIDIRLLKPRDSSSYQAGHYDRWDDLVDWSQGQRFAGRFALFIVLLSYIRRCRSGGRDTAAVVLADNPFGQASSSHILEIVDAITNQQNVQLFSCTALRNTEIMREFPVIYSLVPVLTIGGKERMRIEQKRESRRPHHLEQAHARIPPAPPGESSQLKLF